MKWKLRLAPLMLMALFASVAFGAPRWENPQPQGNIIADVAWNGALYVAVGNAGTILTSNDGAQWQRVSSGTTAWLEAVRWNDTQRQFIVSGNAGTLLTSPDGVHWTRQASGAEGYLYGITNAGNLNVVVGSSGAVITSSDGAHWAAGSAGVMDWLNDVAWNGREFVAVGGNGTIVASADGINWARRDSSLRSAAGTGPSLESIAWSPQLNRWVAVSEIGMGPQGNDSYLLWSNDGVAWNPVAGGGQPLRSVAWDPTQLRFVAVGGGGRVLVSGDGMAWGAPNDTGYGESLETVAAGAGGFVAAGEHGLILTAADPAGAWTRRTSGPLASLAGIAFNGSGYAAVGAGTILHRADLAASAIDLVTQAQGAPLPFLRGIAWGNGGYVAVGDGGAILRSADGVTWTPDASAGANLTRVALAPDASWYAVGEQGSVLHNSGAGWNQVRSGGETLKGVAADAAGIIAVGSQGTGGVVLTSSDGTHWSGAGFPNVDLRGVASGNGRRVVVGSGGTVLTQGTGGWNMGNAGTTSDLNDVVWDGRRFIAVGRDGGTFVSGDGVNWSQQTVTGNDLFGIADGPGGSFIVVGEGGTVVYTACPCATNDQAVTGQNQSVTIAVLANDSGDNLVLRGVDVHSARGGSITMNADGTVTYTPASGFTGTDYFNYTVGSSIDPSAQDTGTVTVLVDSRSSSSHHGGGSAASLLLPLAWAAWRRRRRAA